MNQEITELMIVIVGWNYETNLRFITNKSFTAFEMIAKLSFNADFLRQFQGSIQFPHLSVYICNRPDQYKQKSL
jgi:hypothetical protein